MPSHYEVKTVVEYEKNGKKESRWIRVGAAFPLKNGDGFSVVLDALPVNGKLVIMPPRERDENDRGQPF